jgi:hypothetical protein
VGASRIYNFIKNVTSLLELQYDKNYIHFGLITLSISVGLKGWGNAHFIFLCNFMPDMSRFSKFSAHTSTMLRKRSLNAKSSAVLEVEVEVEVEVKLRPTVSRPVRLGVRPPSGNATNFSFSLKCSLNSCGFVIL